jgi:hypothetical protein
VTQETPVPSRFGFEGSPLFVQTLPPRFPDAQLKFISSCVMHLLRESRPICSHKGQIEVVPSLRKADSPRAAVLQMVRMQALSQAVPLTSYPGELVPLEC